MLLCCKCSIEIEIEQNGRKIEIDQNEFSIELNSWQNVKTQITDLYDDILYYIFDIIEFDDLVNVATAIPEFSSVASKTIHRKFPVLSISLKSKVGLANFKYFQKCVIIYDRSLVLNTLEQFGDCFDSIDIDYRYIPEPDRENITKAINKDTSKTLKRLKLEYINGQILNHLTVPFEEVQEISCAFTNFEDHSNGSTPFNYLFP